MTDYDLVLYRIDPELASNTGRFVAITSLGGNVPSNAYSFAIYETDDPLIAGKIERLTASYKPGTDQGLLDKIKAETGLDPVS